MLAYIFTHAFDSDIIFKNFIKTPNYARRYIPFDALSGSFRRTEGCTLVTNEQSVLFQSAVTENKVVLTNNIHDLFDRQQSPKFPTPKVMRNNRISTSILRPVTLALATIL